MNREVKNNLIDKLKTIWEVKRYRSIAILLIYVIFFIFVFGLLKPNDDPKILPSKEVKEKTILETYQEMNNYSFLLQIKEVKNNNEMIYNHQGKTDGVVTLVNDNIYLKDNVIYEIVDNKIKILSATFTDVNLFKLKPYNVSKLISLGELNYETKYADGSIEKSYLVPLKDIVENFKNEILEDMKTTVEIKMKEKDNKVLNVELDLSNYEHYLYPEMSSYIIKIVYNDLGKIETLKNDYEIISG